MAKDQHPPKRCKVTFEPVGKRVEVATRTTLLEAAQKAGVGIASDCGGLGLCGRCQVVVSKGDVSPPTEDERVLLSEEGLQAGRRLACRTRAEGDIQVHVPESSRIGAQRLQLRSELAEFSLEPLIDACAIEADQPSLDDTRSDLERVQAAVRAARREATGADTAVVSQISAVARANGWHLTAFLRQSEIVGVCPPQSEPLGLAVDVGTTKIGASLLRLADGKELATVGIVNPQIAQGEDVISRLAHASKSADGSRVLALEVREAVDGLLGRAAEDAAVSREEIADICVVGNTAMTHLLAELPVRQLALAPYVPATAAAFDVKARELELRAAPGAYVHVLPCIGGFVGADHVAAILAARLDEPEHTTLVIDIGTNTEIGLAKPGDGLTSVSCPSGPAFEGAHISEGMRAAAGAIEAVRLTEEGPALKTVDDAPPIGLCGSGIVDALAELRRIDVINERGRFNREDKRVRDRGHGAEFLLVPAEESGTGEDLAINQSDINQIQLAKGAIRAGLEVLLDETGTPPEDVREIIIAGAFGSYLRLRSALSIGLLPRLPNARYRQVGNAALAGARWALVSREARERAEGIGRHTRYLELTTYPGFARRFASGMMLPSAEEAAAHTEALVSQPALA
jgi:uncharacterized 2Fe-2S/4Fe-4S cluster protein (DUF4445 family)